MIIEAWITITVEGGGKPIIRGETNLPDGLVAIIDFKNDAGQMIGQGSIEVNRGRFSAGPFTCGHQAHPRGEYSIVIDSPLTVMQPPAVQKVLGRDGKNLRGPLAVYRDDLIPGWTVHFEAPVIIL